jgi:hypothetical protein
VEEDPRALSWGIQKEGGTTVLLAAAVLARLPHPGAPPASDPALPLTAKPADANAPDDPDAMLRRLRELGELRREGVLTDEEFTAAKRTLLGM